MYACRDEMNATRKLNGNKPVFITQLERPAYKARVMDCSHEAGTLACWFILAL
jgi:hypothetical protein